MVCVEVVDGVGPVLGGCVLQSQRCRHLILRRTAVVPVRVPLRVRHSRTEELLGGLWGHRLEAVARGFWAGGFALAAPADRRTRRRRRARTQRHTQRPKTQPEHVVAMSAMSVVQGGEIDQEIKKT